MHKEATRLIKAAQDIEAKERADAAAKAAADAKAKAEALVASGKIPTEAEVNAAQKAANAFWEENKPAIKTGLYNANAWASEKALAKKYQAMVERVREMEEERKAPEKLKKMAEEAERDKAVKKADKIVKKGDDFGDKVTNEGPKSQKLADKLEKIATKASAAAEKYFGAKDKKGVNAQKNKEKMKELVAKQANAIPLEVRIAIQRLSGHNLGQDLVQAGVNSLKYSKAKGKVTGGEDYEGGRGSDGAFTYNSYGDLRDEAKRGGTTSKDGNVTYKGVTYGWKFEDSSNKIGWDPKQFAVHGKLTIEAGVGSNKYQSPAPKRTIFEAEELNIEGG
jgi:hypothetical protein